ncbi:uncharacterized protein LOC123878356 isoform X2 [Maniola jurtina]|uniref:uncharacterized protein LOC123878356 isoform X2 n=1 Tax=Maniola jurtina TaxID=191418 RepID=UPI001E68991C|nr:uncharacterized protein LOC123878356 isoform X2 [Maniola jurtina]
MALVIRKTFLPKNVSILKCMKGRPIASAPNKKHTAPLFTPAARRTYKVRADTSVMTKARQTKLLPTFKPSAGKGTIRLQFSISCPHMGTLVEPKTALSFRQYNSSTFPLKKVKSYQEISKRHASCDPGCPCPFPCGCKCLPPPCNTPPKCVQYMTGYYYYPYGTWFCGPYHVSGIKPDGSNCPCPCPVKCCPACVCAPAQNMSTNRNASETYQFPVEVPCNTPKVPQESKTGMSKIFNFKGPVKNSQEKQKPNSMPPVLSTLCYPEQRSDNLMDKERRIKTSYPTEKLKPRFYHTKTNSTPIDSTSKTSMPKQKNWKYSYYQKRHKIATPMERTKIFFEERKNSRRAKLDSTNSSIPNQKRRDPRPEVDTEIKPYG